MPLKRSTLRCGTQAGTGPTILRGLICGVLCASAAICQECPESARRIAVNKVAISAAEDARLKATTLNDIARLDALILDLWSRNEREVRVGCALEAYLGKLRSASADLEQITKDVNACVACRRGRHWWQFWKKQCR